MKKDVLNPFLALITDISIHQHTLFIAWYDYEECNYNTDDIVEISRERIVDDPLLIKLRNYQNIYRDYLKIVVDLEEKKKLLN